MAATISSPANDIDMEPIPGYKRCKLEQGEYERLQVLRIPDLSTLRPIPAWLAGTALVLADVLDHHDHSPVPHSPRAILKRQIRATRRDEDARVLRFPASVLSI